MTAPHPLPRGEDRPVRRVGALHAALNSVALAMYTTSWLLRRRNRRAAGVAVSLAAGAALGASGYLGGHMVLVQRSPHDGSTDVHTQGAN